MTMSTPIRLGTRRSALAQAQSGQVADAIAATPVREDARDVVKTRHGLPPP